MEIMSLTKDNFQAAVEAAARMICRGGTVIAPTDTVYGLLANAANEEAIERIFAVKLRPKNKPLPIFVKNMAMAKKLAKISPVQEKFLEEKWPGKFTVCLKRKKEMKLFGIEKDTIALRIPFHSFVNSLLEAVNMPLCGTSANISGSPASGKINEVLAQFIQNTLPDLAISAGNLDKSTPSTIIDLTQIPPKIIRP
jgi:L-threonylcarbamoyladenylate synthase